MSTMEDSGAPANPPRRIEIPSFPMAYFMHMILGQDDVGGDTSSDTGLETDMDSDALSDNEQAPNPSVEQAAQDETDEPNQDENPPPAHRRRASSSPTPPPSLPSSSSDDDDDESENLSPVECLRRRVQKIRDYRDLLKSRQQVANVNFKYFIGRKKED